MIKRFVSLSETLLVWAIGQFVGVCFMVVMVLLFDHFLLGYILVGQLLALLFTTIVLTVTTSIWMVHFINEQVKILYDQFLKESIQKETKG